MQFIFICRGIGAAGNLLKRSRYYQAEMDVSSLKPGEDFDELKPGYVIFICTFDPFGKGLYRYTFEEHCMECELALGDGTRKIFLNTRGKNDTEVSAELVHFLKYMEESTDAYVSEVTEESIRAVSKISWHCVQILCAAPSGNIKLYHRTKYNHTIIRESHRKTCLFLFQ